MKQIILYVLISFICVISQSCGTDCSKETSYHSDCGCPTEQTELDGNCLKLEGYTFYFGLVDFYCVQDSFAIGIDNLEKTAVLYNLENGTIGSYGDIPYTDVNVNGFSINECLINDIFRTSFIIFEDKSKLDNLPSQINLDLYLKESPFFGSSTIDSAQISVTRR